MGMPRSEVNTDPVRAWKRALSDLKCAGNKLLDEAEARKDAEARSAIEGGLNRILLAVEVMRGGG